MHVTRMPRHHRHLESAWNSAFRGAQKPNRKQCEHRDDLRLARYAKCDLGTSQFGRRWSLN